MFGVIPKKVLAFRGPGSWSIAVDFLTTLDLLRPESSHQHHYQSMRQSTVVIIWVSLLVNRAQKVSSVKLIIYWQMMASSNGGTVTTVTSPTPSGSSASAAPVTITNFESFHQVRHWRTTKTYQHCDHSLDLCLGIRGPRFDSLEDLRMNSRLPLLLETNVKRQETYFALAHWHSLNSCIVTAPWKFPIVSQYWESKHYYHH